MIDNYFEIIGTETLDGQEFLRVRATQDIAKHKIRRGMIGGLIAKKSCLLNDGWADKDSVVDANSCIYGGLAINTRLVSSHIRGDAIVEHTQLHDSEVKDSAHIAYSTAIASRITNNTSMTESGAINSYLSDNTVIADSTVEETWLFGNSTVEGSRLADSSVFGDADIRNVNGTLRAHGNVLLDHVDDAAITLWASDDENDPRIIIMDLITGDYLAAEDFPVAQKVQ